MGKSGKPTTSGPSKKKGWRSTHTVLGIWAIAAFWYWRNQPHILFAIPLATAANLFEMAWNLIFAFLLTHAILRVWIIPLWRWLFQETGKVGQKLEWYDTSFEQLKSHAKNLMTLRLGIIYFFSGTVCLFDEIYLHLKWFPGFSRIWKDTLASKILIEHFSNPYWLRIKHFAILSFVLWLMLSFEGRSRIVLRLLQQFQHFKLTRRFLKPLPKVPYDPRSKTLAVSLFTAFSDENMTLSLRQSCNENWFPFSEKGQKGNVMVIGPTGGGKTMAVVLPLLEQTICWNAHDHAKKAALVVYDPKAELTEIVSDAATRAGREEDLIIFSLDGVMRVNPIKITNPWDGESSWKVAGWIVGAWQNYQGKSSPEPYWESQNFILTRNLLVIKYFERDTDVTLKDVAESINEAGAGCFRFTTNGKLITLFGQRVLTSLAAIDEERYLKNYSRLEFDDIDNTLINLDVRVRTSERLAAQSGRYGKEREDYHLENNEELQTLARAARFLAGKDKVIAETEIKSKLAALIKKDLEERFGDGNPTDHDFMHTIVLCKAQQLRESFLKRYAKSDRTEQYLSVVEQASKWLLESWSSNAADNRGSIVSNMQPFIQQFQTPELAKIFSPSTEEETLSFDSAITEGKILVPDFPGIKIGNGLAQGIITLIKSRWQHSVLALGKSIPRLKIQIMDEAQRIMCLGDGQKTIGEFDYCELSRSFGGITWFLSQSVASLEAKANREVEWKKVHGVVRSIICLSTNDTSTIKFMQEIAGKDVKKRMSRTVTETANSPGLDLISEKYAGESDSLGISYTVSESLEERLQTSDIQDADAYTGIASIYDGRKNNLCRIALRPTFWPDRRDRYELIQRAEFDPYKRLKIKRKVSLDPIQQLLQGGKKHEPAAK